jgi:ceramide glucosyltransferase
VILICACAIAAGYQLTAVVAALAHMWKREPRPASLPPVSILKPVRGADSGFERAIRSHALIAYPEFEILFGVRDSEDPAVQHIHALQREFPSIHMRLIHCREDAPNAKAGILEQLAREARHEVFVVNDADICVEPNYLRRLAGPLANSGLVTCLYRASGDTFPSRFEALGIATDFAPSALVAPFVGVREFGLGSTLAFRRADFDRAGGFAAIRDFIADDYQVGKRISALGLRVQMARMPVETFLGHFSWSEVWRHQVRWARTIRLSRGAYFGLPVTFATLWGLLACIGGHWAPGLGLLAIRMLSGLVTGVGVLRDPVTARLWWLIPLRDLWGCVVWATGALGNSVEWGGRTIRLDAQGRIVS